MDVPLVSLIQIKTKRTIPKAPIENKNKTQSKLINSKTTGKYLNIKSPIKVKTNIHIIDPTDLTFEGISSTNNTKVVENTPVLPNRITPEMETVGIQVKLLKS